MSLTPDKGLYPKASDVRFAEKFKNQTQVGNNGGTIISAPTISNGIGSFDGTDDKITYSEQVLGIKSVSFDLYVETTTEQVMEFNASQSITVSAGTLTATNWSSPTIYLNGVASSSVSAQTWYRVTITTATAFDGTAISLGNVSTNFGQIQLKNVSFSGRERTTQEASDDYSNQTYNYMNKAVLNLPMHDKIGSAAPFTTSDLSGFGYDFTLGDGSTSTTFPTKLTNRNGYSTDGGDYLKSSANLFTDTGELTMACWIDFPNTTGTQAIFSYEEGITDVGGLFLITSSTFFFYCGGSVGTNAASKTISESGAVLLVGVHDGTNTKIYVNGVAGTNASSPLAPGVTANMTAQLFVRGNDATNPVLSGNKILQAQIYDFALTPTQIINLYNQGSKYLGNR